LDTLKPELSIIIPVYNEELHIADSLEVIAREASRATDRLELIVIDDGSRDRTWEQLQMAKQHLPPLHAIRLSRNFGKELALCAGLEHAEGRAVIVMDGDLQHPPELIPEMVRIWREEQKDVVECVKSGRSKESLQRKWGSGLFYSLLNRMSGFDLQGASDYKLLDRRVIHAWRQMGERATFFRGMTAWIGYNKAQLPFQVQPRSAGASRWGFVGLVKLAMNAIVSFSSMPLRAVTFTGLLFFLISIVVGAHTLYQKLTGTAVTGFTTVILLLLIIGSIILFSLGVIGEYIAAIYNEVKDRPRYLIQDTIGGAAGLPLVESGRGDRASCSDYSHQAS
jgi:polyisoprenyl-phosphate glycosyltransferase